MKTIEIEDLENDDILIEMKGGGASNEKKHTNFRSGA